MEWAEEAIVLGARQHGETDIILEVMTRGRGRWSGLVRGGRSRRMRPVLQPGNTVEAVWRARLDEHLGNFRAEAVAERTGLFMEAPAAIYGVQMLAHHLRLLAERDAHPRLYDAANVIIENLIDPDVAAELMALFELTLLDELGFGLDLQSCAAGGDGDLVYVSPRSARAVSRAAGAPYADRLLALPAFLRGRQGGDAPVWRDIDAAFRLTGYFLRRHVYAARGIEEPAARERFIASIVKTLNADAA